MARKEKWYNPKGTMQCKGMAWHKGNKASHRRRVVGCLINRDGYAKAIGKLNSLRNVTKDVGTKKAANADMTWARKKYRS